MSIKEYRNQFNKNGIVLISNFFDEEFLNKSIDRFDEIFSGNFETNVLPDKVKWLKNREPESLPRSMCNIWKSDRVVASLTLDIRMAELAAKLMNWKGVRLNQDNIFWVPVGVGSTGFHQDNSYQDWHEPGGVITGWVALNDIDENGASLEYAIGSHKWKLSKRIENFRQPLNYKSDLIKTFNSSKEKSLVLKKIPMKKGDVLFHHGNIWHGSNYNNSKNDRKSVSTHYMNIDSVFSGKYKSPMFNHYKLHNSNIMLEDFFPILWDYNNNRSKFLESYLEINH